MIESILEYPEQTWLACAIFGDCVKDLIVTEILGSWPADSEVCREGTRDQTREDANLKRLGEYTEEFARIA